MNEIPGQYTFEGAEITGLRLRASGLGEADYVFPDGEEPILRRFDRVRITSEYVCAYVELGGKHDTSGEGAESDKRTHILSIVKTPVIQVDQVLRREAIDAAWLSHVEEDEYDRRMERQVAEA